LDNARTLNAFGELREMAWAVLLMTERLENAARGSSEERMEDLRAAILATLRPRVAKALELMEPPIDPAEYTYQDLDPHWTPCPPAPPPDPR